MWKFNLFVNGKRVDWSNDFRVFKAWKNTFKHGEIRQYHLTCDSTVVVKW